MTRTAAALLVFLVSCSAAPAPPARNYNECVLEVVRGYPLDGSYGYHWPKEGSWEGTTQDLIYENVKLCSGDPQKRSYCCGLTYEVFFRAYEIWCRDRGRPFQVGTLTAADLHELRLRWFGDSKITGERRKLVQAGIESMGLGRPVRPEEARPGDFIQFWRHGGSGHSAIFINWIYEKDLISGFTYWSSQGSTKGIGYRTELIGDKDGVKRDEIYLARVQPN